MIDPPLNLAYTLHNASQHVFCVELPIMNNSDLLTLFDQEQRREVTYPDLLREEVRLVVRHVSTASQDGFVLYSALDEQTVEAEIDTQMAYFGERDLRLEWKVYDHDQPPDLCDRLARRGFVVEDPEAVMVLDLNSAPAMLLDQSHHLPHYDVRRLTDPADVRFVATILHEVWQTNFDHLVARLQNDLTRHADLLSLYALFVDDEPASAGWTYFHPRTQFASLWGGSTRSSFRRRGLYRALLAVRAQESAARGVRFLTVDAGSMSQPILEKHGFRLLSLVYGCKWSPAKRDKRGVVWEL